MRRPCGRNGTAGVEDLDLHVGVDPRRQRREQALRQGLETAVGDKCGVVGEAARQAGFGGFAAPVAEVAAFVDAGHVGHAAHQRPRRARRADHRGLGDAEPAAR